MSPQETAERVVETCRADGCVAIVTEESEANLRWADSSLTTDGVARGRRVTVIATVHGPRGTSAGVAARRGAVDRDTLTDLVAAAERAAREAEPAEEAQPLVSDRSSADWAAPVPQTSIAAFGTVAPALGAAFAQARAEGETLYGYAESRARSTFLATSGGVRLRDDEAGGHIELTAKSADRTRSAWAGAAGDFGPDVVPRLYGQLRERLRWAARQVELPPGRYETVLPPAAVADLMNLVYWSAGGRAAAEGQTVYSGRNGATTRVGERLTSVALTLRGDPAAAGLECSPFLVAPGSDGMVSVFDNGLPLRPTAWLDNGVLAALVQTRYSARLTGLPLTPHIDNLILEGAGATGSLADLVAATERGLLLTTLWYIREVDPAALLLTGLTRDGVYLVEHGEVVGAVNNFRFNDSPVDLLGRVLDVGRTERVRAREWGDAFTHCAMPPLRVADFPMSSISRAV